MADKQPEALRLAEYWWPGAWPLPTESKKPRKETADELRRLHAEVEALRADAERYRWLRRFDHFATVDGMLNTPEFNTLDAAVDAAIAASKEQ